MKRRTALVTGSTRGIGEAIARALAAEGCNIMLNGLGEPDEIERLRTEIEATAGVEVRYHGADLSRRPETEDLVRSTHDAFGSVDILVNNAVIRHYRSIPEFDPAEWDYAMALNVTAPFDLCRLTLPLMREKGWGRIISMSSVLGLAGRAGRADYVTAKTALIGLTHALAAETLGDPDITANAVCPGSVLTPFIRDRIARLAQEKGLSWDEMSVRYRHDLGQQADFITPERIASLVTFLCRDEARDITGAAIPVDGGLSGAWMQPLPAY